MAALLRDMQGEGLDVTPLPTEIEDAIWALAEGPVADFASGIAALCAQHPEHRGRIEAVAALSSASCESPPAQDLGHVAPAPADELMARLAGAPRLDHGRYEVEGVAGIGGMGKVLRIRDRTLNRRLAMKVVRTALGNLRIDGEERGPEQALRGRFLEEAQVQSQIDHPGVLPVHDLGLDAQGVPCFTMRFVEGHTAAEVFGWARDSREGWTITRALEVILKVCDTMGYAHEKGVLHRDLKPGNVMVGRFGEVYVTDWGLAKVIGRPDAPARSGVGTGGSATNTMAGQRLGTPFFMSPEQARGEALDARSDVYGVGAMMYVLLTGKAPHDSYRGQSSDQVLAAVRQGPAQRIEELARGVPAELVAIAAKAMAFDREQRYSAMSELAADLRAYLDQRVVRAYRTGALVELRLWVRRNKALAASLAAAALILVVGIVVASKQASDLADLATAETKAKEEAVRERGRADAKVDEFNQLAGVVLYERAIANEKALYPAWPHKIEAMEKWLKEDAGRLLAMKPDIERTLLDLAGRALPPTPEEQEADRRSHPRFAELELLGRHVESLRYAQASRSGNPLAPVDLPAPWQALDAKALNSAAWSRVAPKPEDRTVWAEEALGLACAKAAVAKAYNTDTEYQVLDTLAWALLANGQDAEARTQSAEALANAPDDQQDAYRGHQRDVEEAITKAATILATAEKQLGDLATTVSERRTFRFELASQHFLYDTLAELLGKLSSLAGKEKVEVDKRLSWAKQIQALSLAHPNARHTWAAVRAAIASNGKYAGQKIELRDEEITGLVPIGENPVTKLWEFYELRSAWDGVADPRSLGIPAHEVDGSIKVTGDTGIVFVLLPGGTFTMGAQRKDPTKANYDAEARFNETPHEETVAPFFLARHELTQGQWARLWSGDSALRHPSLYKAGQPVLAGRTVVGDHITLANPVEQVDWVNGDRLLTRHSMALPTSAQWEYGCRAGTKTPWIVEFAELKSVANLADEDAKRFVPSWTCEAWTDGHIVHAPVGSFGANRFGLYDVHGNVWEWCRDLEGDYGSDPAGNGLGSTRSVKRLYRGGGFLNPATSARSGFVGVPTSPTAFGSYLGLRPVRLIHP